MDRNIITDTFVTPGDITTLAKEVAERHRELDSRIAKFVAQHQQHRLGERIMSCTDKHAFRVKSVTWRLDGERVQITYTGPVFKKDGGEHANHNTVAWEWLELDGRDLPSAK